MAVISLTVRSLLIEMIEDLATFCCARGFELYQSTLQSIYWVKSIGKLKEKSPIRNLGSAEGDWAVRAVSKPGNLTSSPFLFPEVL